MLKSREFLGSLLVIQVMFILIASAVIVLDPVGILDRPWSRLLASLCVLIPLAVSGVLAVRVFKSQRSEETRSRAADELIDTALSTTLEWVWAVDERGIFTFSSPACSVVGYSPSELLGQPFSLVIDQADLFKAQAAVGESHDSESPAWGGVLVRCRHRDGSTIWMEVAGTVRSATGDLPGGFAGTTRPASSETAQEAAASRSRDLILGMIEGNMLVPAFQPIWDLSTGELVGVEALTRFVDDAGGTPDYWFSEAGTVGLAAELELAALKTALVAARQLPAEIYVALNVSPSTCLDQRLLQVLDHSGLGLERLVLELTERLEVSEYAPLLSALAVLRQRGLRVAIDDAGSGFASMRHVLQIRPDIIKLDRSLIACIDADLGQRALGAAITEFARQIGATVVAEGIETQGELDTVTTLGMSSGQGYLLGRPTVHPPQWAAWHHDHPDHTDER